MLVLATADEMRSRDREAISAYRIPGLVLMENAGRGCTEHIRARFPEISGKDVAIVCGKGNNGGDGFVIARHLANLGCSVAVFLLAGARTIEGDAKVNLDIIRRMAKNASTTIKIVEVRSLRQLGNSDDFVILIDAIFGTGFSGEVTGLCQGAIQWINKSRRPVVSIDIASGVDGTNGTVGATAVKADVTLTMGMRKVGQFVGNGRECSGETVVIDISIPKARQEKSMTFAVEKKDVREALPGLALQSHKYSRGKLLVVGGSRQYTGAPSMTAESAMKAGAGATVVAIPLGIHEIIAKKLTEVMLVLCPETTTGSLSKEALNVLIEKSKWADAVAIGPGLSRNQETMDIVWEFIKKTDRPLVIDADALHSAANHFTILKKRKAPTILTPHYGEFSKMSGMGIPEISREPLVVAREFCARTGCVLVLKGAPTITSTRDGMVMVNTTGNPGMATIGSGDILTGLIGSLLAQGIPPDVSSWAGVYLHGYAGDLAAHQLGPRSVMAMDIAAHIPSAMKLVCR